MKPKFRSGTKKAIEELAEELNLPFDEWMQDWPFEVVNPSDIDKYINHYKLLNDDNKKIVLLDGIIQSVEEQSNEELFQKYLKTVRQILEKDYDIYEYQIYYWACLENNKNEIDDCWKVTPMIRDLINTKKIKNKK